MKRNQELPKLQKKARFEAGKQLALALDLWTRAPDAATLRVADQLIATPPYALTLGNVRVLKHALARRGFNTRIRAARVCAHEEQLWAWIAEPDAALSREELREKAKVIAVYLANVFIPSAARLRRFRLAVAAVRRFLSRLSNPCHADIWGAGAAGDDQESRHLLLGPCLCSLAYHYPRPRDH